jgi:glycosyltransferase involved in cell wall biosynthesis
MSPLFSIITINYNNHVGLEKTVQSITSQNYSNFEFIIIDGGSSDDFLNVINTHEEKISFWCSEKDKGIYDAQNKGIQQAKGEYLVFMNSGDAFSSNDVLEKASSIIASDNNKHQIFYGNTNLVEIDGSIRLLMPPKDLTLNFFYFETINHQACFIKRSLFDTYGLYDLSYKLCADFDFFLKVFFSNHETYRYINEIICDYENYGVSSSAIHFDLMIKEREDICKKILNDEQLDKFKRLDIKLLGRKSKVFNLVPKSEPLRNFYDKFYYQWYKLRTGKQ